MGLPRTVAVAVGIGLWLAPPVRAGDIRGAVRLSGKAPEPVTLTIEPKAGDHSTAGCGDLTRASQRLLVDPEGGVQNAVVWLEGVAAAGASGHGSPAVLDQQACEFVPHVLLIPHDGTLAIRNSDPVLHNTRIFRDATMLMHEWQAPQAGDLEWRFDAPGRYLVRCGVHSWMHAWVVAAEHPYYGLTDSAGRFTISGVPRGTYTLSVWHEALGEQRQRMRVRAGRSEVVIHLRPVS